MSDVSSVTLDASAAPRAARASWKQRGGAAVGFFGGALLAVASMCAKPTLPGGLWLGALGTLVAAASLLALLSPGASAARVVGVRSVAAPVGHALAASV